VSGSSRRCVGAGAEMLTYRPDMKREAVILLCSTALCLSAVPAAAAATNSAIPPSVGSVSVAPAGLTVQVSTKSKRKKTAKGPAGNQIRVSKVRNLAPFGNFITVRGKGFSETVGVYVALCKKKPKGKKPGPCGGGADTDGSSQASAWVSSNPPPYGRNLAQPYQRGGNFKVRIKVSAQIGSINCRIKSCAIVVRADHLNSTDRRWDLSVPVRFR
jgi:hypothetical protein